MKKVFLIFLLGMISYKISCNPETQQLREALENAHNRTDLSAEFANSVPFYQQRAKEVHDIVAAVHPDSCKADHITSFGILTLVAGSVTLGALITYGIIRSLEKTHS